MTTERDLRNQMAYATKIAIEEGLEKGFEEGRKEGRAEEREKVIHQLHSKGLDAKAISKLLEFDVAEIEKILSA